MIDACLTLGLIVIKALVIIAGLMLLAAYLSLAERKIIGFIQNRIGPNRVGPWGLLQPLADGLKLLFKEVILPSKANRYLFMAAPVLSIAPSLAAWAVIPFSPGLVLADINVGILYLFAMTSLSVYGIVIAGWASNSKYAFLGALRSAAQVISYEIAMGFAIIGVIIAGKSMNLTALVEAQSGNFLHWFWLPLFPLLVIYWISAMAETNRLPFDVAEGESEIVAGFHVEYAGITFALFFIAEYANMALVSTLTALLFLGGWLSPFQGIPILETAFLWVPSIIWLFCKVSFLLLLFLWIRATLPRYRYDQIMRLGWKIFIPISLVWVIVVATLVKLKVAPWFA